MPTTFNHVFIEATGVHLPGEPIDNEAMDDYIAPLNRTSGRIKQRILAENGIKTRHYAIDTQGRTQMSHSAMAAAAVRTCLGHTDYSLKDIGMLSAGSSGGDALMPGFASMMQGELAAPPMETLSSLGVCVAGMTALKAAAQSVELGAHTRALAVAAEMPSRMFKKSRFAPADYALDFNAHFLRWMLSDGAGAMLLTRAPKHAVQGNKRLRVRWIHQVSFSGDYPVCMQLGLDKDGKRSFVDYDSAGDAERDGAMCIRQDIRLLPHLFDVSIHEFVKLHNEGWFDIKRVDHFLCHYSSERFAPDVENLLNKAELDIPRERWYSNLTTRGNTGAASIYIMLDEFLRTRELKTGEQIFCFVPESGRFSAAYMLLEVEDAASPVSDTATTALKASSSDVDVDVAHVIAPHDPASAPNHLKQTLTQLAQIWHDYRSKVWRTPLIQRIVRGQFSVDDYRVWTAQWTPQVREGSLWMREGIASLTGGFTALGDLIETHAGEEQNDFQILYRNYTQAGGTLPIDSLKRNPGGEALNSFLHSLAATPNPIGLLGAIYIIEGTGQRIVPHLLPMIKQQVDLPRDAFAFLQYHGANDENHLRRWLQGLELALLADPSAGDRIVQTAQRVAQLYQMQFDMVLTDPTAEGV
ncbi:MAG: iron-containing redox enzyme family protein [Casimicrobium sp.]